MLRARRRRGRQPLQLARRRGPLPGLLERLARRAVATPRLQAPEHDQRRALADAELLAQPERRARVGLRPAPLAAPDAQVGADPEHVLDVAVELALGRRSAARARRRRPRADRRGGASASRSRGSRAPARRGRPRPRPWPARTPPRAARARARVSGPPIRTVPTFVSPWATISASSSVRASRTAREPSAIASSARSPFIASCARPLRACASSRLSGKASSTAIARSPTVAASLPLARPPEQAREQPQRVARAQRVAGGLVEREQRAARLDGALRPPAQVRLDGDALERLGIGACRPPAAPPPSARAPAGARARRPRRAPPAEPAGGSRPRPGSGGRDGPGAPGRRRRPLPAPRARRSRARAGARARCPPRPPGGRGRDGTRARRRAGSAGPRRCTRRSPRRRRRPAPARRCRGSRPPARRPRGRPG